LIAEANQSSKGIALPIGLVGLLLIFASASLSSAPASAAGPESATLTTDSSSANANANPSASRVRAGVSAEAAPRSERERWSRSVTVRAFIGSSAEVSSWDLQKSTSALEIDLLSARIESNYRATILLIRDQHFAAWHEQLLLFKKQTEAKTSRALARERASRNQRSNQNQLRRQSDKRWYSWREYLLNTAALIEHRRQSGNQMIASLADDLAWAEAIYREARAQIIELRKVARV